MRPLNSLIHHPEQLSPAAPAAARLRRRPSASSPREAPVRRSGSKVSARKLGVRQPAPSPLKSKAAGQNPELRIRPGAARRAPEPDSMVQEVSRHCGRRRGGRGRGLPTPQPEPTAAGPRPRDARPGPDTPSPPTPASESPQTRGSGRRRRPNDT